MESKNLIADSESLGAVLKRARELRGIRLEEVAEATRVRLNYLQAIEQNQLDQLPGLVFLRGYVRAYVNYVGLNPDEMMVLLEDFTAPRAKKRNPLAKRRYSEWGGLILLLLGLILFLIWVIKGVL